MSVRRLLLIVFLMAALLALGGGVSALWWIYRPLPMALPSVDLSVEPGMLPREVAQTVADAGVDVSPTLLFAWFRLSGRARDIKAGSYELERGITPQRLLQKLARGEEALRAVPLIEGWTFRQFRAALAKEADLKQDLQGLTDEMVMTRIGRPGLRAEGRFFPDTYTYAKGSSDIAVLRRAQRAMDRQLAAAWALRTPRSVLRTPDDALVLASIVEKETGHGAERTAISAVFHNRMRIGMPLQTDPTVIYGMGTSFDGNLRRDDLRRDTPWNTYTRPGLPPTPIAMPGREALRAAVQPADNAALYFVSKGNGTSHFSTTLGEHNRAVNKYQRGQ